MKQTNRLEILKALSILAVSLFIYAVTIVLRKAIFGFSGGFLSLILFYSFVIVAFIVGNLLFREESILAGWLSKNTVFKFIAFSIDVDQKKHLAAKFIAAVSTVLPVLTAIVIYRHKSIFIILFETVFAFIPYMVTIRVSDKHYQEIMVNGVAYTGFFILAGSLLITVYNAQLANLKPAIYALIYLYILIFLILRNQEDIDVNIFSKKYIQKSILPKNMRRFNMIAVLILYSVILLLFNFKSIVEVIVRLFGKVVLNVIMAVMWLISQFIKANPGQNDVNQTKPEPPIAEAANQSNIIVDIIMYTLAAAIAIYVLYITLPMAYRKIKSLVIKLLELIRKLFNIEIQKTVNDAGGDYNDETVTIRPGKDKAVNRTLKRNIRKARKELGKISDPVERIRFIYSIILNLLVMKGVARDQSDTVAEIFHKSEHISDAIQPLSAITKAYDKVRYGEIVPDAVEMKDYENNYSAAVNALNKR